ncbi:baculoviral IAP repeat-containing protein 7-A-like [Mya arenaria]|uniref:baculoviral IAP repeat-containing protein 7-A-like n=1 Tax=Mya arenaria TaxID=6604 RepID=UPI0022E537C6|nr:baculoviral IAP repeat-containing protein 7-A-like [Mya arenaria]
MASKDSVVATKQKQDVQKPTPMGLGISTMKPKFPQYALPSKRQESFTEASIPWPQDAPVGVEKLVEAGLVYTGVGDSVRCYHCGGGLRNWEEGDDPMEEHAKWYPTCQHVLIAKGKTYIRKVEAGENPKTDSVVERKKPELKKEDPFAVTFQALAEFGYSENEAKIALNIFKKRNGSDAPFKAADLVAILMEIEDDPDVLNEYNVTDTTESMQQLTTQDTEAMDDIEALEEENQKLKESSMCKICLDNRADVIFLPCGHIVSCPQCAPALDSCPVCRKSVMGLVKAFFATKHDRRDEEEDFADY